MNNKNSYKIRLIALILIIILINILGYKFTFRLDFTEDKRYTLSDATISMLKELDEPVTIKAYISDNLHPQIDEKRTEFKDLLVEFENRSGGNVLYEFINPNENQEAETEAQQKGIAPATIQVRERDQYSQKRAYVGAVVQKGEQTKTIAYLLADGTSMEYLLTSTVKSISVNQKPKVGFVLGHGEPDVNSYSQVNNTLQGFYTFESVNLTTSNLLEYNALIISGAKDSLSNVELNTLNNYLNSGKNLLIACNKSVYDFTTNAPVSYSLGIESWLAEKGLVINNDYVVDAKHSNLQLNIFQRMPFAYYPIINNFGNHVITDGLESLKMEFLSSINYNEIDSNHLFIPLLQTSNRSLTLPSFSWDGTNTFPYNQSKITVAGLLEGDFGSGNKSKILVFTDGGFAVNGTGRTAKQLPADNISLMANAIDWIAGNTELIELRTREVTSRPIRTDLEDSKKTFIKYVNFATPIILVILYGFIRLQRSNKKRQNWLEEDFS